jgi:hypothetical protein
MRLALWVAPALLFRALIPVGFMLEPVAGGAEIVLCGADAPCMLTVATTTLHIISICTPIRPARTRKARDRHHCPRLRH